MVGGASFRRRFHMSGTLRKSGGGRNYRPAVSFSGKSIAGAWLTLEISRTYPVVWLAESAPERISLSLSVTHAAVEILPCARQSFYISSFLSCISTGRRGVVYIPDPPPPRHIVRAPAFQKRPGEADQSPRPNGFAPALPAAGGELGTTPGQA